MIPAAGAVLVLHVFSACLCDVLFGRHPGSGTQDWCKRGETSQNVRDTPALRSARPWGQGHATGLDAIEARTKCLALYRIALAVPLG